MNQYKYVLPDEKERHLLLQSPLNGDGLMLLFEAGLIWLGVAPSPLRGPEGNIEFLAWWRRGGASA